MNHLRHKNEDAAALLNECESLLALSEEVAERCGLARFCMGGGSPQSSINIPSIESLRGRSKFVFFTPMQLAKMGISLGELAPFIHPAGVLSDEPDTHSLELYPIVQAGENLLLALPAAISPAIRSHVINTAKAKEFGEEFRQVLVELEKAILIRDFGPRMGGTQMSFQSPDPTQTEAGICYQLLFRFDLDKLALVILFSASYSKVLDAGLAGIQEQTDSEREALTDHLFQTVEAIETQYKVSSGVVLAVFGGLGRARAMSFKRFPRHWHLCGSGIHNFVTLSKVKDMSFLMLWKLQSQERALEEMGINISNANGIVNLVGYWEHFGGRLVPVQQDLGSRAQLMVGCDFIAAVRQRVRTTHNVHAVRRSSSATWRVVSRLNIDPYFTSEADEPIFVDYDATRIGELYGLMEGDKQQYWLIHDQAHKALWQRDFARRVWDSLLSWTRQLGPIIEAILPSLPTGPLEIIIEFDRLSDWNKPTIEAIPTGSNDIEVHVCAEFNQIKLVIPVELVRDFATPQNVAELALLRSMLCGLCHLAKRSISPRKLDDLVNRVVKE